MQMIRNFEYEMPENADSISDTAYAAALYVPLVYDEDSLSFAAGDDGDIVLVPAKTTLNYAAEQ